MGDRELIEEADDNRDLIARLEVLRLRMIFEGHTPAAIDLTMAQSRLAALRPQAGDREAVARAISSNPAYLAEVRDEQQTWLADHLAQAIQALYRRTAK